MLSGKRGEAITQERQLARPPGRARLLTGRLYKLWVGVVRDEWDGQVPEVEFQRTSDDVDVFIHVHRNICFLTIFEGC